MPVTVESVSDWMARFAASMQEHREELVRLDTAIGDGDHGTNMDRGMRKALEKLEASQPADPGAVLKTVAMSLISSVVIGAVCLARQHVSLRTLATPPPAEEL